MEPVPRGSTLTVRTLFHQFLIEPLTFEKLLRLARFELEESEIDASAQTPAHISGTGREDLRPTRV